MPLFILGQLLEHALRSAISNVIKEFDFVSLVQVVMIYA
jgi:hypothetical protein